MSMATESLEGYYRWNTSLQFDHGMLISDIENQFPFETELYYSLRIQELERRKNQNGTS